MIGDAQDRERWARVRRYRTTAEVLEARAMSREVTEEQRARLREHAQELRRAVVAQIA